MYAPNDGLRMWFSRIIEATQPCIKFTCLNATPWLLFITNIQDPLKLDPIVNGATWDVVPHALKGHGTTELLAFNEYGARGCLVTQPWSNLDVIFGINCVECG
jgi:hypothetical protein